MHQISISTNFVLGAEDKGVGFFGKTGVEVGMADFLKNPVIRGALAQDVFKSIVGMVVHDRFAGGVVGLFGID